VHRRENFKHEDKKISHLYIDDIETWKKNAVEFIEKHITNNNKDFYIGYGIHILTDIIWRETVYSSYKLKYDKDTSPIQDKQWAYYNDTDQLDFMLYKNLEYCGELWKSLYDSKAIDVDGLVSSDEIDAWNVRTLHWFDSGVSRHKNPIKYINYDNLIDFIAETTLKIEKYIHSSE
jgi:hypothetical protein